MAGRACGWKTEGKTGYSHDSNMTFKVKAGSTFLTNDPSVSSCSADVCRVVPLPAVCCTADFPVSHLRPVLVSLFIINYKILLLTYKSLHALAPQHLPDLKHLDMLKKTLRLHLLTTANKLPYSAASSVFVSD